MRLGGFVDVNAVRRMVPLPETADEVCFVAKALGATEEDIFLGARANEREIKQLSASGRLHDYRVLHFSTHSAVLRKHHAAQVGRAHRLTDREVAALPIHPVALTRNPVPS